MWIWILGIIALLILALVLYASFSDPSPPNVATIKEHWLFRHTQLQIKHFHRSTEWLMDIYQELGMPKTVTLKMVFFPRFYNTWDPQNIEHVLKTNFDKYGKGPAFHSLFVDLLGDGIFNVDGAQWYAHRKIASHLFNVNNFKNGMLTVFNDHSRTLVKILRSYSGQPQTVDMHNYFNRFTLDSIGTIAFGHNIGSLEDSTVTFAQSFDYAQYWGM